MLPTIINHRAPMWCPRMILQYDHLSLFPLVALITMCVHHFPALSPPPTHIYTPIYIRMRTHHNVVANNTVGRYTVFFSCDVVLCWPEIHMRRMTVPTVFCFAGSCSPLFCHDDRLNNVVFCLMIFGRVIILLSLRSVPLFLLCFP